ncbi:hypothetical protein ABZP36_010277 [Zizania latifolia]
MDGWMDGWDEASEKESIRCTPAVLLRPIVSAARAAAASSSVPFRLAPFQPSRGGDGGGRTPASGAVSVSLAGLRCAPRLAASRRLGVIHPASAPVGLIVLGGGGGGGETLAGDE